jgi:hypothetical protein
MTEEEAEKFEKHVREVTEEALRLGPDDEYDVYKSSLEHAKQKLKGR